MALIEFEDLPSTNTPIDADNLNNNFNELAKKNIITASTDSDYYINSTNTYETIPLSTEIYSGDKLVLNNNGIKIGSGVNLIKVSGKMHFQSLTNGIKWLTIYKNGTVVNGNPCTLSARNTIYATETLVQVQENDIIYLKVYGTASDRIRSGIDYTNITVEVIN